MPEIKALHPDAAPLKSARQLAIKPISLRPGCLVLDRDMRLPLSRVLRTKPVEKPSSQLGPDRFQGWAFNGKGNARPKMANTCYICQDRSLALGDGAKVVRDLFRVLPRQPVKHGQMRSKEVSLRREMRLSQEVKCLEIGFGNPGGEDQRMTRLQLNSALCLSGSPRLHRSITLAAKRVPAILLPIIVLCLPVTGSPRQVHQGQCYQAPGHHGRAEKTRGLRFHAFPRAIFTLFLPAFLAW